MSRWTALPWLLVVLLVCLIAFPMSPTDAAGPNVLANPSFELGMHRTSLSSWVSDGWSPWFVHGGRNPSILREPEFAVRNRPKEAHDGVWSMAWFNSYGTHNGGIWQRVAAPKGQVATFSIWMIGHSSKNDTDQFGPSTATYRKWVGIDPYGGTNALANTVIWTGPNTISDQWVQMVVTATVQGDAVTVFTRGEPEYPVKNNACVVDDASLIFSPPAVATLPTPKPETTETAPGIGGEKMDFPGTEFSVSGAWLDYYLSNGGFPVFGPPRSNVIRDQATGLYTQYFSKAVLMWRMGEEGNGWVARLPLGDLLYPEMEPPLTAADAPAGEYVFYPFGSEGEYGLGHFVSNYAPDGQPTYFLDFLVRFGGSEALGFPKEEPKLRDGIWTQRFQAATLEHHPENDIDGFIPGSEVPYRDTIVILSNLGDQYIAAQQIKLP